MQLVVDKLAKAFGAHEIFHDVSFMVAKGEKIGLVGVNGSGKSTLVKCLLDPEYADRGTVSFAAGLQIGYVEQGFDRIGAGSVWEFMLEANPEILALRQKLTDLEKALGDNDPAILESYSRATQRYEYLEGYQYEAKLKMVLFGLAFPEAMWQQPAQTLSGGQKTRLLLAAALVSSPEFMLLDEPTSNLDIRNQYQVLQITRDLCREQNLTAMIVIHDLNLALRFCDRFLLLREGEVYRYGGAEIFDADALRDVYGVTGSIVDVQGHRLVLIDDEEKETRS